MCGINGFNFKDKNLIEKMNGAIKYRGPDDSGIYIDPEITFGHNRLSIIDLSAAAHQPMMSRDGNLIIVYNGELYNFPEIKKELENKGRKFVSLSDTEVILQAYDEFGPECLQKFNGIFAFAIWNKEKKELFLARDHFGVKPLFYYYDGQKFIFSSEIKSILEHKIGRDLNEKALNTYFRLLYINGPETIWKNIFKLQPARYLLLKSGKINIKKYWQIESGEEIKDKEEIKSEIRRLLAESVKRQLVSDVPVGIFLSGGTDSTIVLGLMSRYADKRIKTFSVGFEAPDYCYDRFNEDFFLAKKTAAYYNAEHYGVMVKESDVKENLEKAVWHMDDLVYSPTQIANLILAELARKQVKVTLGGDGGDELFGGYERYYYYHLIEKWQAIPGALRENLMMEKLFSLFGKKRIYERINLSGQDLLWSFMAQKEELISRFLKKEINNPASAQKYFYDNFFPAVANKWLAKELMAVDLSSWLVDYSLVRTDKMSMACGLEQRVPFLDKDLAQFAFRIPTKFKINNPRQGKQILKEAMKEYLPEFIYNKKKSGWFVPAAKWLRGGLKNMAYEIISPGYNNRTSAYIDFAEARKILDDHISGKRYALNAVWSIINFQVWYKQF